MATLSNSKTFSDDGVTVNIKATHNSKFQCAILYVEFDTRQTELLAGLLHKFTMEKILRTGINMNNGAYSAISGETSVMLMVPENKITQNISLLYAYLTKTKLNAQQARLVKSGNYNILANDIKTMNVIVTGKCKTFIANMNNADSPKFTRMLDSMTKSKVASREAISNGSSDDATLKVLAGDANKETVAMYLSVVLGNIPCKLNVVSDGVDIHFFDSNSRAKVKDMMLWKDTFQAKIKTFLGQTGSVGTPSAGADGKAKWESKCKNILACQNELANIMSGVRGFKYSFRNVDQFKSVDSRAIKAVKDIRV